MPLEPTQHELVWLKELQRRITDGVPVDAREMMVALRHTLPPGFRPATVNPRFLYNQRLSLEGLHAIGDSALFLPDVDRAVRFVRDRLIQYPGLVQVTSSEIAEALGIPVPRAESVLGLFMSLGSFLSGASASPLGLTSIVVQGEDVLADYLAFQGVEDFLRRKVQVPTPSVFPSPPVPLEKISKQVTVPNTVFILMSMDPQDDGLVDVHRTIKAQCAAFDLVATRVDEIEHQERITDQILERISTAEFIVADLSGEKPNVYYEVGYAHAIGKRPILIRKHGTRLHFDLSVHNVPEYRNITMLEDMLSRRLEAVLGRSPRRANAT